MQKLPCVLLVDDDTTTNFINEELLNSLGVTDRVLVTHNGQQALDLLADDRRETSPAYPVLVFLDVNMPVMNGIEFLEAYRPKASAPRVVVVVLTTSLHPRDMARLRELPHADLINKPLTEEHITNILQKHFQA